MGPIDIILLALIAVAFVAVLVRIKRKGACGDCSSGDCSSGGCSSAGACSRHCDAAKKSRCAAAEGIDAVEERLSRGMK